MFNKLLVFISISFLFFSCKKDKEAPEINQFQILNNKNFQFGDTIRIAFDVSDCGGKNQGLDQILFQLTLDQDILVQGLNGNDCEKKGVFNFVLKDKYFPTGSPIFGMRVSDKAGNQRYLSKTIQYTTLPKKLTHYIYQNGANQLKMRDTLTNVKILKSFNEGLSNVCVFNSPSIVTVPFINAHLEVMDTLGVLVEEQFLADSTRSVRKVDEQRFFVANDAFGLKFMNATAAVTSPSIWSPFTTNYIIKDQALVGNYIGILESVGGQYQLRVHFQASALKNSYNLNHDQVLMAGLVDKFAVLKRGVSNTELLIINPEQSNIPNAINLNFRVNKVISDGEQEMLILTDNNELLLLNETGTTQSLGSFNVQHMMYDYNTNQFYFSADQLIYGIQGNSTFVAQSFGETVGVFDFLYNK